VGLWLLAALKLLGQGALLGGGAAVGQALLGDGDPQLGGAGMPQLSGVVLNERGQRIDHHGKVIRRRRRRRALTASDKADIGFIVGLIGPKAGERFAVALGARSR